MDQTDSQNVSRDQEHGTEHHDQHLTREFLDEVKEAVDQHDPEKTQELVGDLHAADVADLLQTLGSKERIELVGLIGENLDPDVLYEIEGKAREDLYEHLPNEQIADAFSSLESDEAIYVLEDLSEEDRKEVLKSIAHPDRLALEEGLSYPEDSAGRLMQRNIVALPEFWTVGQTIDYLRSEDEAIPDDFYDIYIVDPAHRPLGSVPLSRVMRTGRSTTLADIMDVKLHTFKAEADQEDVAYQFTQYHLISAAVVNDVGRLVGVVTVDDIVDVIEEEAEEDILSLVGVSGDSDIHQSLIRTTRSRFTWLFVNLGTAVLASIVIGLFEATIEQMVALAVLMPIVASMGGNAGTQTMALTVRAIATKDIHSANYLRLLNRELMIALLNGFLLAAISVALAYVWFHVPLLGWVFGIAMLVNIIVAGFSGMVIPLSLNKMGMDPALASSVFVTTITDVVGFFAFLGLAAIFLL